MSPSTFGRAEFCRDDYEQATGRATSLFSALPPDAVRSVAKEALARVAARDTIPPEHRAPEPSRSEIEQLCRALLSVDAHAAAERMQRVLAEGATVEDVYLRHLAPAARLLGEWWDTDKVTFLEVTMATARIFAVLRTLDGRDRAPLVHTSRTAVFAAVPGETHTLGIRMAADLFRRAGWDITLEVGLSHDALVDRVTALGVPLIGLSAAGAHAAPALARLIVALRVNVPAPMIAVGGQILQEARQIVEATSPDAVISGTEEAQAVLTRLWDEKISPRPDQTG